MFLGFVFRNVCVTNFKQICINFNNALSSFFFSIVTNQFTLKQFSCNCVVSV